MDAIAPAGHEFIRRRNKYGRCGGRLGLIRGHPSTLEACYITLSQERPQWEDWPARASCFLGWRKAWRTDARRRGLANNGWRFLKALRLGKILQLVIATGTRKMLWITELTTVAAELLFPSVLIIVIRTIILSWLGWDALTASCKLSTFLHHRWNRIDE